MVRAHFDAEMALHDGLQAVRGYGRVSRRSQEVAVARILKIDGSKRYGQGREDCPSFALPARQNGKFLFPPPLTSTSENRSSVEIAPRPIYVFSDRLAASVAWEKKIGGSQAGGDSLSTESICPRAPVDVVGIVVHG